MSRLHLMTPDEAHEHLARVVATHASAAEAARALGITPPYLCQLLQRQRELGPRILAGLGLEVRYARAPRKKT